MRLKTLKDLLEGEVAALIDKKFDGDALYTQLNSFVDLQDTDVVFCGGTFSVITDDENLSLLQAKVTVSGVLGFGDTAHDFKIIGITFEYSEDLQDLLRKINSEFGASLTSGKIDLDKLTDLCTISSKLDKVHKVRNEIIKLSSLDAVQTYELTSLVGSLRL